MFFSVLVFQFVCCFWLAAELHTRLHAMFFQKDSRRMLLRV